MVDRLRTTPHGYILILSHMRSGSSLLLHLLQTSSEINGCGERNTTYERQTDLTLLAIKSMSARQQSLLANYSADQINHTRFVKSEDLLLLPSVYPIILTREPKGAIESMVDVLGRFYDFDINDALAHYRERLPTLARYAELLQSHGRMLSLTYDELVHETDVSLVRIRSYLALQSELSSRYSTFDFTGKRGDPSPRIQSGKVLGESKRYLDVISSTDLRQLTELYDTCHAAIRTSRALSSD